MSLWAFSSNSDEIFKGTGFPTRTHKHTVVEIHNQYCRTSTRRNWTETCRTFSHVWVADHKVTKVLLLECMELTVLGVLFLVHDGILDFQCQLIRIETLLERRMSRVNRKWGRIFCDDGTTI
jgi:hypothetical protein